MTPAQLFRDARGYDIRQVVRAIGDTPTESGADAQARIAKEYFAAAEDWE